MGQPVKGPSILVEFAGYPVEVPSQLGVVPSIYRIGAKVGVLQKAGIFSRSEKRDVGYVVELAPSGSSFA